MNQETSSNQQINRSKSILSQFVSTVFWSFFLGILILVMISAVQWKKQGYPNMLQNLNSQYFSEVNYLTQHNTFLSNRCVSFFNLLDQKIVSLMTDAKTTFAKSHLNEKISIENNEGHHSLFTSALADSLGGIKKITLMLWESLLILSFKFINVFGAISLFVFALLFGALNGLVTRYVRTMEGGRESTFMFHKMTGMIIQLPLWIIILYFVLPLLINPTIIIGLLTGSLFLVVYIATSSLKKFI